MLWLPGLLLGHSVVIRLYDYTWNLGIPVGDLEGEETFCLTSGCETDRVWPVVSQWYLHGWVKAVVLTKGLSWD